MKYALLIITILAYTSHIYTQNNQHTPRVIIYALPHHRNLYNQYYVLVHDTIQDIIERDISNDNVFRFNFDELWKPMLARMLSLAQELLQQPSKSPTTLYHYYSFFANLDAKIQVKAKSAIRLVEAARNNQISTHQAQHILHIVHQLVEANT
jgi:hypothetical protein